MKSYLIGGFFVMFGLILILNITPEVSASPTTYTVGPTGDFPTINQAYNFASAGDIIEVYIWSTYSENVVISKDITITGVPSGGTLPDITSPNSAPVFRIDTHNIEVEISNFEIIGTTTSAAGISSSSDPGFGEMDQEFIIISNCKIHGFTNGYGIHLYGGANYHQILNCEVYSNNNGIFIESGDGNNGNENIFTSECVVYLNTVNGIYNDGDYNWFVDNWCYGNYYGMNIYYSDHVAIGASNQGVYDCSYNYIGIYASNCEDLEIVGYDFDDHLVEVHNNSYVGIYLDDCNDIQISEARTNYNTYTGFVNLGSGIGIIDNLYVYDNLYFDYCSYYSISLSYINDLYFNTCDNFYFYMVTIDYMYNEDCEDFELEYVTIDLMDLDTCDSYDFSNYTINSYTLNSCTNIRPNPL